MVQDSTIAQASSEEEERIKVRRAQKVLERSSTSIGQVCLIILTMLAVLYTLFFAAAIILPFVLALVLALVLGPAMRLLNRRLRIPRMIAALLLIVALFSVVGAMGYALSVPASGWIAKAPQSLPALVDKLRFLERPIQLMQHGVQQLQNLMSQSGDQPDAQNAPRPGPAAPQSSNVGGSLMGIGSSVLQGGRAFLGEGFTLMLLLFFFLASSDTLLRRFIEILPHLDEKRRAVSIVTEIENNISRYLLTITLMNALVGLFAGLAVWLLGMPDPLLFGTLAFLLNYIPIIGPVTGMVIFFFVGVFTFPSIWQAFIPAGIYLGIHVLEGETITPMLLASRFTLNPVMVISSLMFWDWLWGIPGALLSMPLLAVTKIVCDHIEWLMPLGHLLGGSSAKSKAD
ncbi:MAG TPA: AI-2E family transporter [Acetobacteraceae bacterium]|nr:AI-2E family transporter [Acetobacteraceae bacterium]